MDSGISSAMMGRMQVFPIRCLKRSSSGFTATPVSPIMSKNYLDCGMLLYDRKKQDMHAGGSGCGCSAAVLCGYLLPGLRAGKWRRILFAPTGALLSPTSSFQGESIPGVCHAVCISAER